MSKDEKHLLIGSICGIALWIVFYGFVALYMYCK